MTLEAHFAWKRRIAKRLPDLAARTFALRGKMYAGCGCLYALEKQLGSVIRIASTLEHQGVAGSVIDRVIVEGFHKDLLAAESSALRAHLLAQKDLV